MSGYKIVTLSFLALGVSAGTASAQAQQDVPESNVTIKSLKAVGYRVGGWSTKVDLKGTRLMSTATGEAKVEARQGKTNIEVSIKDLAQPTKLGAEFLTYVLWVITPDGRSGNTGEILINKNGEGKLSGHHSSANIFDHCHGRTLFCRAYPERDGHPGERHAERHQRSDPSSQ
jgi:hypothetical protein